MQFVFHLPDTQAPTAGGLMHSSSTSSIPVRSGAYSSSSLRSVTGRVSFGGSANNYTLATFSASQALRSSSSRLSASISSSSSRLSTSSRSGAGDADAMAATSKSAYTLTKVNSSDALRTAYRYKRNA